MDRLFQLLHPFKASATALCGTVVVLYLVYQVFERSHAVAAGHRLRRQVTMTVLTFVGLLMIVLTLPLSETLRGQLVTLIGILLSATIALSSTTLVGNAMAGVMLRAVRSFRLGDFIHVGEHFGRVSERGLFHIEIQTEDRDLLTLPNLYLVSNPFKVMRSSGTVISATVSLGYDQPWTRAENLLLEAVKDTGLEDPFVMVLELGDFSITYRAAGLLKDVKQILSVRSRLREHMLDRLHEGGVEIVSPTFMNQRQLGPEKLFIPRKQDAEVPKTGTTEAPEQVIFDKAEQAESLERLREILAENGAQIARLKAELAEAADEEAGRELSGKLERMEERRRRLARAIELKEQRERK